MDIEFEESRAGIRKDAFVVLNAEAVCRMKAALPPQYGHGPSWFRPSDPEHVAQLPSTSLCFSKRFAFFSQRPPASARAEVTGGQLCVEWLKDIQF